MKCSKCGKQIKNLPDYMEETGAEVLCSSCAGTMERSDEAVLLFDHYRSRGARFVEASEDLDVAA
jgi:hypothetical protein